MADNDFPWLTLGMIFIQKNKSEWIIEDCTGLVKTDSVLPLVVSGFLGVPFEYQGHLDTLPS
jgi:hypothetical protein